jgi:hypothetical protein
MAFLDRISSNPRPHDGTNRDRAESVYRASATRFCEVGGETRASKPVRGENKLPPQKNLWGISGSGKAARLALLLKPRRIKCFFPTGKIRVIRGSFIPIPSNRQLAHGINERFVFVAPKSFLVHRNRFWYRKFKHSVESLDIPHQIDFSCTKIVSAVEKIDLSKNPSGIRCC